MIKMSRDVHHFFTNPQGKMNQKFVIVRCATQNFADLKVELNQEWTILDFKRYLSQNHASKPDIDKQRLIFAGQLMKNEIFLRDYLKKMSENFSPIIHLVCAPDLSRSAAAFANQTPAPKPHVRSAANLNAAPTTANFQNQPPPFVNSFVQSSPDLSHFHQNGAFLQPHAAHFYTYYNQYLQYLQQIYGAGQAPMAWAPYGRHETQMDGREVMPEQAPVNPVLNNDVANAPPLNVDPPAAVDDAGFFAGRDFLDVIYMLLRSSIIFVVLFAYSSIERTIFVMLVVFLLFAYQNGWFARRNIQQQQRNNDDNNNRIREENNVNNGEGNPVDTTNNSDEQMQPQSAWNVFWSTCYTFVSSFFSSLIPERPPPINNF